MEYKAIIVEDDTNASTGLNLLIDINLQDLKVIGICDTVKSAVENIKQLVPDLIFLDIDLPDGKGFDVIEQTKHLDYGVIFTTAHEEYAVKAFELAAVHYLTKPINDDKLIEAYERFKKKNKSREYLENIDLIRLSMQQKPNKIVLPSTQGNKIVNINDLIWCKGDGSYTKIFIVNSKDEHVSRTLGTIENALKNTNIVRIHKSTLINVDYVSKYSLGANPTVTLANGKELIIGTAYRDNFEKRISKISNKV